MIPERESLTVEFKSDAGNGLPDKDLVEAAVCLANSEGGEIWLGVEDDGKVTGLSQKHRDPVGVAVLLANRTLPNLAVRCAVVQHRSTEVLHILVPKSRQIVGTTEGKYLRRRLRHDGRPECAPMLPHDIAQRQSALGQLDATSQIPPGAELGDLDPAERMRLRGVVERYNGDRALLSLTDEELDGALGLSVSTPEGRRPTLAGLLVLGRAERLRQVVPSHEVAFQVLQGTSVATNEFFHGPLLGVVEEINSRFDALNAGWGTEELEDGLFRISVPRFEKHAFRESFMNAIIHRDYSRLGAVHIRFEDSGLTVSNPGGFVEGVTMENLLTVEPRPRNPLLADAMKRLGLVERTGRGVDRIFEGMLRFGRPEPDYSRSDSNSVVLMLSNAAADASFLRMLLREEGRRGGGPLPVDALLVLSRLKRERRLSLAEIKEGPMAAQFQSRGTLERLTEAGLIEAHGTGRGRTYTLSAKVYDAAGTRAEYVRQAGFDTLQHEQMVLKYVEKHGRINRAQAIELCKISEGQATRLLRRLADEGRLTMRGARRGAYYEGPARS